MNIDGSPVTNRPIDILQTSHQFLIGCGVFEAVEMMKSHSDEQLALLRQRVDKWLGLFNYGTIPFYWGGYEPEPGKPPRNLC